MLFKTRKSREIYDLVIAHRGIHDLFPENTIKSYDEAIKNNYAIELDIRFTKDEKIVCFHDRYTKRLLGIKGKTSKKTYEELKKFFINNSNEKVPLFKDVLEFIDGRVALLIEVKSILTKKFSTCLLNELKDYQGVIYFHAKNIITYFILRKTYKNKVFFILNPIRMRFNFIKSKG